MSESVTSATVEGVFKDSISDGADAATAKLNALGDAVDTVSTKTTKGVASLSSLRKQLDENYAATNAYASANAKCAAQIDSINIQLARGNTTQAEATKLIASAEAQRDAAIAKATKTTQDATKAAAENAGTTNQAAQAASGMTEQHAKLAIGTAGVTREFVVLGHEIVTGQYNRIPGSLIVLAERTDALHKSLGAVNTIVQSVGGYFVAGFAVAAVGALVAAGVAAESYDTKLIALQQNLRVTRDDYTTFAQTILSSAQAVAASSTIGSGDALAAGKIIGSNPNFSGTASQLQNLIKLSGDVAVAFGVDIPKGAEMLSSSLTNPTAAAKKLVDEGFTGIDAATARTIERMQASGDSFGAGKIVIDAYRSSLGGAAQTLTPLQQALSDLSKAMTSTNNNGQSFAHDIGEAFNGAAAIAVKSVTGWVQAIQDARAAVSNMVNAPVGAHVSTGNAATTPDAGGGIPTLGTPIRKSDGTYEQATGLMQVLPSTARGYGYSNVGTSQDANIYAGVTDLITKFQQSNQDLYAALGHYGGASSAQGIAGYNNKVASADISVLDPSIANQIHDATIQVAGSMGIIGTQAEKLAATSQQIAVVESGGHQYATGAQLVRQNAYATGNLTNSGLAETYGPPNVYGPQASQGQLDEARRQTQLLNGVSQGASSGNIYADRQNLDDQVKKTTDAMNLAVPGSDEYNRISSALDDLKAKYINLRDPVQEFFHQLEQSIPATQQTDEVTRTLKETDQALNEASVRRNGTMASSSEIIRANTDVLQKLSGAYNSAVVALDRQITLQAGVNSAYSSGYAAVQHANDYQQAYNATLGKFVEGSPAFNQAVDGLTAKYDKLGQQKANAQTLATVLEQQDELTTLTTEGSLITANVDTRNRELAVLKERQTIIKQGGDLESDASQKALANAAAIASATTQLQQQQGAINELSSLASSAFGKISDEIVTAFENGTTAGLKFGDVVKSIVGDIIKKFLELSVLNPILNSLFGQNNTTLGTVGGLVGSLLGNGSSGSGGLLSGAAAALGLGASSTALTGTAGPVGSGLLSSGLDFGSAVGTAGSNTGAAAGGLLGSGTGILGSDVSASTALAGIGALASIASLAQGKGVSVSQGLGLASSAYKLGSALLTSPATTAAANAAATAQATAQLGASAGSQAVANAAGGIGGSGSLLGNLGFDTGAGTFSGITTSINGFAESAAEAIVNAAHSVVDGVTGVATSIGQSIGIIGDATGAAASAAGTGAAAAGDGASAAGAAAGAAGDAASGASAAAGAATSAVGAVTSALPFVGVGISVVTDLINGNYRGAGLVAGGAIAGAYVGSIVPVIGTAIGAVVGAAIGGLVDAFLPNHPKTPYQATEVDAVGGQLAVGKSTSQLLDPSGAISATSDWVNNVNTYLTQMHLAVIESGKIGSVGEGIKGYTQVTDPSQLLPSLRFTSTETSDNLGITEAGDLPGHQFNTGDDLRNQLVLEAEFADRMSALGLQLQAIGVDFNSISIASVQQAARANSDPIAAGATLPTPGSDAINPDFQNLLSDFRTALGHDLPNQVFANEKALDTEIDKVYNFITNTMPSLIDPVMQRAESDTQKGVDSIIQSYLEAENQAQSYGLSIDSLSSGMYKAINLYMAPAIKALDQQRGSVQARYDAATGDQKDADLINYDIQSAQEQDAYSKSITDTFGNAYLTTKDYADRMAELEKTQAAERAEIVQKYADQQTQATEAAAQAQLQAVQSAASQVTANIKTLDTYVTGLGTGSQSPLSAQDQASLAYSNFTREAALAQGGDNAALSGITGYADTALKTNQAVYGSGDEYTQFFGSVLASLQAIATPANSDALTASALAATAQAQTTTLVSAIASVQSEIAALRAEVKQSGLTPGRIAS